MISKKKAVLKKIRFFYFNPFKKLTQGTLVKHKKNNKRKNQKNPLFSQTRAFLKIRIQSFFSFGIYLSNKKKFNSLSQRWLEIWQSQNDMVHYFLFIFKKMLLFAATQKPQNKTKQKKFLTLHIIIHIHFILYKV